MPVIQKIFPDWDKSNERNNLQRKEMNGAIIDFRGASTPGNFRRLTKQVVEGDEVDGWPLEVAKKGKGEGSPIELALVRIKGQRTRRRFSVRHRQSPVKVISKCWKTLLI